MYIRKQWMWGRGQKHVHILHDIEDSIKSRVYQTTLLTVLFRSLYLNNQVQWILSDQGLFRCAVNRHMIHLVLHFWQCSYSNCFPLLSSVYAKLGESPAGYSFIFILYRRQSCNDYSQNIKLYLLELNDSRFRLVWHLYVSYTNYTINCLFVINIIRLWFLQVCLNLYNNK